MGSIDLAEWMREEHNKVEDLANEIRARVAAVPRVNRAEWLTDITKRFEHLRAHLTKHMALEEHEGYLGSVLERRPSLSGEVERLRHEHGEMSKLLDGIHASLEETTVEDDLLIRDCCMRINQFLDCVDRHEDRENVMVLDVFSQDIGTKD